MGVRMKVGDCYFNPLLVPFKIMAFTGDVTAIDGNSFEFIIVEFVWTSSDCESTISIVDRSTVKAWIAHEKTRKIDNAGLRCLRKYSGFPLELTGIDREVVESLWSVYGNAGPRYTQGNHEFLAAYLKGEPEIAARYQPTDECIADFKRVLDGDYGMLSKTVRATLEGHSKLNEHLSSEEK